MDLAATADIFYNSLLTDPAVGVEGSSLNFWSVLKDLKSRCDSRPVWDCVEIPVGLCPGFSATLLTFLDSYGVIQWTIWNLKQKNY